MVPAATAPAPAPAPAPGILSEILSLPASPPLELGSSDTLHQCESVTTETAAASMANCELLHSSSSYRRSGDLYSRPGGFFGSSQRVLRIESIAMNRFDAFRDNGRRFGLNDSTSCANSTFTIGDRESHLACILILCQ